MNKVVILELSDLRKSFKKAGKQEAKIFEKVNLKLKSSELVGIIAPSVDLALLKSLCNVSRSF